MDPRGSLARPARLAAAGRRLRLSLDNPVLAKEFRTRMRGSRAYALLLTYTVLLTLVLGIAYLQWLASVEMGGGGPGAQSSWAAGRHIYQWVFAIQAVLISLITPALTAGAITIEREQRAYEMLVMTRLRPLEVVGGKLVAALAFVALLLTSSLPLLSLSFFFGGVSPGELFFTYLSLALAAFAYGAIGILWSSIVPTTSAATVLTYGSVFAVLVATAVFGIPPGGMLFRSLNPVTAVFNCVDPEPFFGWQLPSWISAAFLNGLAGLLLAALAARRLDRFVGASPALVRLAATALWLAFLAFTFGYFAGYPGNNWALAGEPRRIAVGMLGVALATLAVVAPIFATGDVEIRRGESAVGRFLGGLHPLRMFGDDLPAGASLMVLWVVLPLGLVPLSYLLVGHLDRLPGPDLLLPACIVMVAYLGAFIAVGNMLSVLLPSRWAALTMTYLSLVALTLLPLLGLITWQSSLAGRATPALEWQFLYLVPFLAYWALLDPTRVNLNLPPLYLSAVPFWVVTSLLYAGIAAGAAALCLLALRSRARRIERGTAAPELALDRQSATV